MPCRTGTVSATRWLMVGLPLLLAVSGCSTKRPVVHVDPSFNGKDVREGRPAFLLPAQIDVQSVVQDFVRAFDGNPADGESFLRSCLASYLTGAEPIPRRDRGGMTRRTCLGLVDLASETDTSGMAQLVSFATDRYGVGALTVSDPDHLAQLLEQVGSRYLVIFPHLVVQRSFTSVPIVTTAVPGRGVVSSGGGNASFAVLSSDAYVWSRDKRTVVWHGYVNGAHPIETKLTRNTVNGMAVRFALDLAAVLK